MTKILVAYFKTSIYSIDIKGMSSCKELFYPLRVKESPTLYVYIYIFVRFLERMLIVLSSINI